MMHDLVSLVTSVKHLLNETETDHSDLKNDTEGKYPYHFKDQFRLELADALAFASNLTEIKSILGLFITVGLSDIFDPDTDDLVMSITSDNSLEADITVKIKSQERVITIEWVSVKITGQEPIITNELITLHEYDATTMINL